MSHTGRCLEHKGNKDKLDLITLPTNVKNKLPLSKASLMRCLCLELP
jgi:hypothetical protein